MVTVTALPTAAISYTGSPWCTLDGVQYVTLTGTSGGAYSASPSGLSIDGATGAITPSTSVPGTYTVSYNVSAAGGCGDVTATTSVTVNLTPLLVITDPVPVCTPNTADITDSSVTAGSSAGLTLSYWTDAGATIPYLTPTTAGAGTYYIKGVSVSGCFNIKPVTVVVVPLPTTPAISGGGKTQMCKGTIGQFYSVPFKMGNTYNWSVTPVTTVAGGGTISNNFIVLDFPDPGVYTLSVQEFTSTHKSAEAR